MSEPSSEPAPGAPNRQAPTRPPGTIRIGTIAGSDVLITSSWFVVAGLIAVVMAPRVDAVQPGLGPWKYALGFVIAVALFLAVLLHEVSHAVMARRYGYPVHSITLSFFGGRTLIEGEARTPRQEFLTAVVGPLTSLAVGGAALGVWFLLPEGLLRLTVEALAFANLLLGVMNMVPGLPLDGGRVLKAAVWRVSGTAYAGTIAAGWGGRLTAIALLLLPTFMEPLLGRPPGVLDYVVVFVFAVFLWSGATAEMASARLRSRLPRLVARDLARRTLAVPDDLPLAEAVRRAQQAEAGSIVTVTSSGRAVGVVNEAALLATPEERRPWVAVSTVTRTLDDGLRLPTSITGEALVQAITRTPATEYVLLDDDGSVYGVLTTADVDKAFRRVAQ